MRVRNYIPLLVLIFLTLPGGLGFLYVWEGHAPVIAALQILQLLFLFLTYRAGIRSAQKNFPGLEAQGKILYLPFKVNAVLFIVVGQPIIWLYSHNSTVLMVGHTLALTGFSLAYLSMLTYLRRSAP